jgi:hypothetical protein
MQVSPPTFISTSSLDGMAVMWIFAALVGALTAQEMPTVGWPVQ